jgi:probable addiction module antidote protein
MALDEEPEVFLIALRHVMNAQKRRLSDVAAASGMHRVSLHKVLSSRGNPRLRTLAQVLDVMNMRLQIASKPKRKRKSA